MTIDRRLLTHSPAPTVTFDRVAAPDLAIVTVTYGTGAIVLDMLESVAETFRGSAAGVEVVVVDQPHPTAPRTASLVQLSTRGVQLVITDANHGFGGGCEVGVACSTAPTIAFVNPDVVLGGGWFEPLAAVVDDDPLAIGAPVFHAPDGRVIECGLRIGPDGVPVHRTTPPAAGALVDVDYASAACWVLRRALHTMVGGFDAAYHPAYYEDVDYALRVQRLGGRTVVHGDSHVVHRVGTSTPATTTSYETQLAVLRATWPHLRWRRTAGPH